MPRPDGPWPGYPGAIALPGRSTPAEPVAISPNTLDRDMPQTSPLNPTPTGRQRPPLSGTGS